MQDINIPTPKLHLFVCINDRTGIPGNTTPSCGPRITPEDAKKIKRWIVEQGLATTVYCTKAKCLGFCNAEGSVACIYPRGRFVKGIQNVDDLKKIVLEELEKSDVVQPPVLHSASFYH